MAGDSCHKNISDYYIIRGRAVENKDNPPNCDWACVYQVNDGTGNEFVSGDRRTPKERILNKLKSL